MKRALMYVSVASMIQLFNMENIMLLQELGYKVDVACNFKFGSTISQAEINLLKEKLRQLNVDFYHIPIPRKITDFKNIKNSYKKTKRLMNEKKYDLIHCHSPIGGIICRLANKNSKNYKNSKIIYTAHGFHFFKGNNLFKNFLFRNIEKYAAKYTDIIITINMEDYKAAKKFKLKENGTVEYVPGVGIDIKNIQSISGNRKKILEEFQLSENTTLLVSVGELSKRKNHEIIIRTLPSLPKNIHYFICGQGNLHEYLLDLAKQLDVTEQVHLLGFRRNVIEIVKSCDIFVFPSLQEGLPVALMEAMACGLPCLASNIRGNVDLIKNGHNGYLVNAKKQGKWAEKLLCLINYKSNVKQDNIYNYDIKIIHEKMRKIYIIRENI